MKSLEDYDKLASAIQHAVTTIGIIIGGAWGLFSFLSQHVVQKATLDAAKTEAEIKKIEQDSLEQPILRTTIRSGNGETSYPASIAVTLRNEGKLALKFRDTKLSLLKVPNNAEPQSDHATPIQLGANLLEDDG